MMNRHRPLESLPLFAPPRSHTRDPDTSKAAERRSRARAATHAEAVLELLRSHPGAMATLLSDYLAADERFARDPHERLYQVRRRLSDLRVGGRARIVGRVGDESAWEATAPA